MEHGHHRVQGDQRRGGAPRRHRPLFQKHRHHLQGYRPEDQLPQGHGRGAQIHGRHRRAVRARVRRHGQVRQDRTGGDPEGAPRHARPRRGHRQETGGLPPLQVRRRPRGALRRGRGPQRRGRAQEALRARRCVRLW